MNQVVLIGRLVRDPELRFVASNSRAVANFTLAVNRPYSKNDEADFLRVVVWGNQAGSQCAVMGSIQTGSYQDKDGKTVYTTDINAQRVEFLGSPSGGGNSSNYQERNEYNQDQSYDNRPQSESRPQSDDDFPMIDDDDVPF